MLEIFEFSAVAQPHFGLLWDQFALTLDSGVRTEAAGPFYYHDRQDGQQVWAMPPLWSYLRNDDIDSAEFDFLYPLIAYDRFGSEYRFHIMQLFSFAGGQSMSETNIHRFTLFPLYFQQRSAIPERNYTALVPFYGHLQNRLFRNEIKFVLLPIYVQSRKRDVVTDNYVYPLFHLRQGDGLKGWQFWPLAGHEHKDITWKTNMWDEAEQRPGHDKFFALWPFFFNDRTGVGSDHPQRQQALIPFYNVLRSPQRDSTSWFWPLGVTHTVDREKKYEEWGAPWPLVVFDRGEGKHTDRVWPFFSQSHNDYLISNWYLWPLVKYNRVHADPLDRQRTRIALFLYSDTLEKNTESGASKRVSMLFPFFSARRDFNGNSRLQVGAILEPFIPGNKSIERDWSPLWSFWRSEKNAATGASSQSLFWNLYRRDSTPSSKKCSLLFGLFQYQSSANGRHWRLFYIPFGRRAIADEPLPTGVLPPR